MLVAEDEAGALQEDRGDLFFTISVENKEPPLYIEHYSGTRTGAPTREARGCPLRTEAKRYSQSYGRHALYELLP